MIIDKTLNMIGKIQYDILIKSFFKARLYSNFPIKYIKIKEDIVRDILIIKLTIPNIVVL